MNSPTPWRLDKYKTDVHKRHSDKIAFHKYEFVLRDANNKCIVIESFDDRFNDSCVDVEERVKRTTDNFNLIVEAVNEKMKERS